MNFRQSVLSESQSMECKQPSEEQFSSPSIEISYTRKTSRLSLISHISTSTQCVLDISKNTLNHDVDIHSDSLSNSSNYEEDDDSKMMELPDVPIYIAEDDAVRIPLTPQRPIKPYRDPYSLMNRGRVSPLQIFQSKQERSKYSKYKVVDSISECTSDANNNTNNIESQPIRSCKCLNDDPSNYWHRFTVRLSLSILLCTVLAVTVTLVMRSYPIMAIYAFYGSIGVFLVPFIAFCVFALRICVKYHSSNVIPSEMKSIEESPIYKNVEIRKRVIDQMNRKHFKFIPDRDLVHSTPSQSASSSLNTILSSIYNQSMFIEFPPQIGRVSLLDLHELIQIKILNDFHVDIKRFPKIKLEVEVIDCEYMGLKRFREWITGFDEEDEFIRTYFIVQMNKQPLFYCDADQVGLMRRVKKWVSEHDSFGAVVGCHMDQDGNEYVMMVDGDQNYMVSVERLYEAIRCRNHKGECGGLLRIRANSIM